MSQVGTAYGEALYDLARDEGLSQPILAELKALNQGFAQEPEFLRLLSAPNLPKQERCRIVDDSFRGKVHPYVLNFLKILTEKGYTKHFDACVTAYRERYNQDNGILPVTAVTAAPLTEEQAARLTQKLTAITGKTVELINKVDPAQLGGVRLDYDGKRVEDTVAGRLRSIGVVLKNTVL